ncbi:MAG: taurine dioxygenase [Rhodospirillaceae bacterium]|jgi:taurine dioxygenase|nr:taurine dioxygenase [Rhodospirillaceae bacterium]MBT6116936.1 taurine dioxygenase [Rhodospirillaceae bacterium]
MSSGMEAAPIAGALGAELHGVDLAGGLSDAAVADIRRALLDHLVVFFRDQALTPETQIALARRFGAIAIHPIARGRDDHPEIVEVVREPGEMLNWGSKWHADTTGIESPPMGSILYARAVPPFAGDTCWANLCLAHDTLSDGMKAMLGGMHAVHSTGAPGRYVDFYKGMRAFDAGESEAVHPVVRSHPETGRPILFVNRSFTRRFDGMTEEESRPLLDFLFGHSERPEFTCRFRWRPGSVAFWDNRCTIHDAIADYWPARNGGAADKRRVMHRVMIEGDRPV